MDRTLSRNQKSIFNLIYVSFVFSLVYLFGRGIDLTLNILLQILVVLIGSILVKFFLLHPLILYTLLATSFLGVILVHRFIRPILFPLLERVFYLFENIIKNLQGKENITSDNILLFWILLVTLVSFFTAFILFKGKSIYSLLPIYISLFIYYWYNFFDEAYWMISIFLLAFFILMGLDKYSRKGIQILYTPWLQTVVIYSILIVFIALLLPKSNNYVQWPWLQQKVYKIFPNIENLRSYNSYRRNSGEATLFNFSTTGFQKETSRLGGPVNLSDKKIMTVRANSNTYLRGNVKQIYTGNSWDAITEPSKNYLLTQSFSGLSKEEQKLYYNQEYITIINHNFASTTLFSPYKAAKVSFTGNYILKINRDDVLIFSNGIYDGESYLIQVQKPLPYGMLVSLGIDKKKKYIADLEIYLQIPEDKITERTKSLVKTIVKNANSDFEKAKAIENYLRNNYQYSLDVSEVPQNKEFVDYFLFEGKEGYCTYYATTLAIMLRLEGIPSRYIEGYLAKDLIERNIYEVKHNNAHTWVEAFIEPVGWMTFEPTPAYSIEPRFENYQPSEQNNISESTDTSENTRGPRDDINGQIIDIDLDTVGNGIAQRPNDSYEDIPIDLRKKIITIFIAVLLLIIPLKYLIGLLQYRYQEAQARKLSNNERIIYLYKQTLRIMEFLGYPQLYGETHYEYANRVANKFYSFNEIGIKEITEIFVRSKYSNSSTSDEDVLTLENYRVTLEERLKNYLGKITYYYSKYVKRIY